jgi:hypothetical protein
MSKSPEIPGPPEVVPDDNLSCAYSDTSAPTASQTDVTSPTKSPGNDYFYDDNALSYSGYPSSDYETYVTDEEVSVAPYMYGVVYGQDDIVGRYLAFQAAAQQSKRLQAPAPYHVSEHAGYLYPGYQPIATRDLHINDQPRHRYPDTESIRHLHSLHSLLPLIQPERKLNALSGPVLNIHTGSHTGPILCHEVPKKLLVLFLGRSIVSRYLHTISRQDNTAWTGPPTQQSLILPANIASSSALKILVAWMTRACTYATMLTMRPLAVPENLFSACTLAQTMELLGLKRDAYHVDLEISARLRSKRRLFAVEIETLWRCLGESNRYVYAAVKAFGRQVRAAPTAPTLASAAAAAAGESTSNITSGSSNKAEESTHATPEILQPPPTAAATTSPELLDLKERYPQLYDRIRNEEVNEQFAPQFGRNWFSNLPGGGGANQETASVSFGSPAAYERPAMSAEEAGGSRGSSSGDTARAAGGRGRSRGSSAARPLDPKAEVFRPAAAWGGEPA